MSARNGLGLDNGPPHRRPTGRVAHSELLATSRAGDALGCEASAASGPVPVPVQGGLRSLEDVVINLAIDPRLGRPRRQLVHGSDVATGKGVQADIRGAVNGVAGWQISRFERGGKQGVIKSVVVIGRTLSTTCKERASYHADDDDRRDRHERCATPM